MGFLQNSEAILDSDVNFTSSMNKSLSIEFKLEF